MNPIILSIIIIVIVVGSISTGLYFWLRNKDKSTKIKFQTSCDIQFLLSETTQVGETVPENFLFSPMINYYYEGTELARDMTNEAIVKDFPLSVTFENGRFIILCTAENKKFYIIDQEFNTNLTNIEDRTYISQYGAAQRFLNHLYINWPISYFPNEEKTPQKEAQSTQDLSGMTISLDSIPSKPTNLTVGTDLVNKMTILWTPTAGNKTGIYLKDDTSIYFQNWDLVNENIGTYTFENLPLGTYIAGISSVGKFDESEIVSSNSVNVINPIVQKNTLDFVTNDNRNNVNKLTANTLIYNEFKIATDFSTQITWPIALTKQSQILNIKIEYYTQLIARYGANYPTLPSDSRIEMEEGATTNGTSSNYRLLDYMYWKRVTPRTTLAPNIYIFGSTDFSGNNQGGPPLPWEILTITDRNIINKVFPADSNGDIISKLAPNLRFYCGYLSNQLKIDDTQVPIQTYSIDWTQTI